MCKSIYSLKELHDLLETHPHQQELILFLDLDLTLIQEKCSLPKKDEDSECEEDELIEPEVTRKLFDFLHKQNIWYTFVTARFHDHVLVKKKKRDEILHEMTDNIEKLYPIFEELGVDCSEYKSNVSDILVIKNDHKKPVGIMYKGLLLGDKKGELIKFFRKQYGIDKTHPHVIFLDDIDKYIKSVKRHVPDAIVLKREIKK